ncbi:MAG TPA: zinc-binding dehydrogenase [Pyrinomonadaceae bacterium]|nr:zinc-binding dehydrogenase [Pyrinomonadaceae bacterium]
MPDMEPIPATMRAVELRSYEEGEGGLTVVERPVPRPGRGQVLVRMAAAPVNPSDLMFVRGLYGQRKRLPVVPGFEGSGVVVASGGGLMGRYLLGRRVACAAPFDGDGTWAEYMAAPAAQCIPLRRSVGLDDAASMIVNPFTAWALMDIARRAGARGVVQTAAASALGRMVVRLGRSAGVQVVNVVRRDGQVKLLQAEGAQHVLNSAAEDFDERLRELCARARATVAFEAVAGETTGRILRAMPKGGRAVVYGALSQEGCLVDPRSLIFESKRVEGFWLSEWLGRQNAVRRIIVAGKVQKLLAGELKTEVRARLPLERAAEGLRRYQREMTGGKIILVPGEKPEASG